MTGTHRRPVTALVALTVLAVAVPLAATARTSAAAPAAPTADERAEAAPFPDVPATSAFAEAIDWMVANGLTTGYDDGGFHPTAPVTRQAASAFLARYGRADGDPTTCSVAPFPDVPTSHPFCGEIAWLAERTITGGYADGGFHPGTTVSRQAMAAFLHRLQLPEPRPPATCTVAPFPDVPTSHPFCGEIAWLAERSITQGYPDGGFHPTAPVSRQAAAAFLFALDPGCQPAERTRGCPGPATPGDLDGDGKAEITWYDTWPGVRWYEAGSQAPIADFTWLTNDDTLPTAGDFDGDGAWEPALVDTTTGTWHTTGAWGAIAYGPPSCATDPGTGAGNEVHLLPVVGDWDGDRRDEPGWYCEADATWHRPGHAPVTFGEPKDGDRMLFDHPVPGDYDGDGDDEPATYRPRDGSWWALGSAEPLATGMGLGLPVPADHDGDGDDDAMIGSLASGSLGAEGLWQSAEGPWVEGPGGAPITLDPARAVWPHALDLDGDGAAERAALLPAASGALWFEADGVAPTGLGPGDGLPGTLRPDFVANAVWLVFATGNCLRSDTEYCPRSFVDADLDGDGTGDPAWVRSTGTGSWTWHIAPDTTPLATAPDSALPMTADYDGDGRWEPAWVDPATGTWTTTGRQGTIVLPPPTCGAVPLLGDGVLPVVGDFDHDLLDEPAWYCVATGTWHFDDGTTLTLGNPYPTSPAWAAAGTYPDEYYDLPIVVAHPYDGDLPAAYSPVDGTITTDGSTVGTVSPLGLAFGGATPGVHRFIGYQQERVGEPDWAYPFGSGTAAWLPGPVDLDGDGTPEAAAVGSDTSAPAYLVDGEASIPLGFTGTEVTEYDAFPVTMPAATFFDIIRVTFLEQDCYENSICPPGFTWPAHVPPPSP